MAQTERRSAGVPWFRRSKNVARPVPRLDSRAMLPEPAWRPQSSSRCTPNVHEAVPFTQRDRRRRNEEQGFPGSLLEHQAQFRETEQSCLLIALKLQGQPSERSLPGPTTPTHRLQQLLHGTGGNSAAENKPGRAWKACRDQCNNEPYMMIVIMK